MSRVRETIYLGKDNAIDLILQADGAAVNLSSVTRMILRDVGCEWEVDSATSAGACGCQPCAVSASIVGR